MSFLIIYAIGIFFFPVFFPIFFSSDPFSDLLIPDCYKKKKRSKLTTPKKPEEKTNAVDI